MKALIVDVVILIAVALVGALATGWLMQGHKDKQLAGVGVNLSKCTDAAAASGTVLDTVQQDQANRLAELQRQVAQDQRALASRDVTIHQLRARAQTASRAIEETPRDHPDCAALARLSVCPAVAGQLWPDAYGSRPAPAAH